MVGLGYDGLRMMEGQGFDIMGLLGIKGESYFLWNFSIRGNNSKSVMECFTCIIDLSFKGAITGF